jgi:hypothetical protein
MKYIIAIVLILAGLGIAGWKYGTGWITKEMVSYHDGYKTNAYVSMPRWRWWFKPVKIHGMDGEVYPLSFSSGENNAFLDPDGVDLSPYKPDEIIKREG